MYCEYVSGIWDVSAVCYLRRLKSCKIEQVKQSAWAWKGLSVVMETVSMVTGAKVDISELQYAVMDLHTTLVLFCPLSSSLLDMLLSFVTPLPPTILYYPITPTRLSPILNPLRAFAISLSVSCVWRSSL
jgi:hypothetical protein